MIFNPSDYKNITQSELNLSLISACKKGNLNKVVFLLTSPELIDHANLHCSLDSPFRYANKSKHMDIIRFFIIDMNIEKTDAIKVNLKYHPNHAIEKMFEMRALRCKIAEEIKENTIIYKRVKI